jgi:hypothetical protein
LLGSYCNIIIVEAEIFYWEIIENYWWILLHKIAIKVTVENNDISLFTAGANGDRLKNCIA